ncbi:UDP-glucose 4-epimerase GalE [Neisseriaceae bacterium PsAf]|nr:UDP-glucose 4-epimerase GalE [Neisseriaceae bacterium PsAf]MCV2502662.1 UDP-glucose 4-epimerase GalE [Neisseriaceae bacterium]
MILVTGGTGYIGSHTVLELLQNNYEVLILDNLSNSNKIVLSRLEELANCSIPFIEGDVRDRDLLKKLFTQYPIESVIHFAGLKAVGESVQYPLKYYDNNVNGSIILTQEMQIANIKNIVFSSSATVYGTPKEVPIKENMPTGGTTNPYGTSKSMVERILTDLQSSDPEWSVVLLRYFNPIGAHQSGKIGEDPNGIPNNLLPYISQVAIGKLDKLSVFGDDYPTKDGTGVRDYIHVVDLANGHIKALQKHQNNAGRHVYNLGTGQGYSVLETIHTFEKVTGQSIPYEIVNRRDGDIAVCYSDPSLAKKELHWQTHNNLEQMMVDTWNWQKNNPNGYK